MENFWNGFEKRAYDYAHEVDELENYNQYRSQETPLSKTKAALVGSGLGGLLGAGAAFSNSTGSVKNRILQSGIGGLRGAGVGGITGFFAAIVDEVGIENAKKVMAMPEEKRKKYMASLARHSEFNEKEENKDRRHRQILRSLDGSTDNSSKNRSGFSLQFK